MEIKRRRDGLKVKEKSPGKFEFRTVVEDFTLNDTTINQYLSLAGIKIDNNYKHKIGRFPGRNTWKTGSIESIVGDTKDETEALYKDGYRIFGWDTEWDMNFQIVNIAKKEIQTRVDEKKMDWENEDHTHPYYDLYDDEYIEKDRPNEKVSAVVDDIEDLAHKSSYQPFDEVARKPKKVILLMHERAFRSGKNGSSEYYDQLEKLITTLKNKGFKFDTLANY